MKFSLLLSILICLLLGNNLYCQAVLIKDLTVGANSTTPKSIVSYKNKIYFLARNSSSIQQLYSSDLTIAGTGIVAGLSNSQIIGNLAVTDSVDLENGNELPHYNLFFVSKRIGPEVVDVYDLKEFDGVIPNVLRNLNLSLAKSESSPITDVELDITTQPNSNNYESHINPITKHADSTIYYSNIGFNFGEDSLLWSQNVGYDTNFEARIFPNTRTWFFTRKKKGDIDDNDDVVRGRDDNAQGTRTPPTFLPDTVVGITGGYTDRGGSIRQEESRFLFFSKLPSGRRLKALVYPHNGLTQGVPTEPYLIRESAPLSIDVPEKGIYFQEKAYFKIVGNGIWQCDFDTLKHKQVTKPTVFNLSTVSNLTLVNDRAFFTATTVTGAPASQAAPSGGIFEILNDTIIRRDNFTDGRTFVHFFALKGMSFGITKLGTTYTFHRYDGTLSARLGTALNVDISAGFALINGNTLVFSANNGTTGQELYRLNFTVPNCSNKPSLDCGALTRPNLTLVTGSCANFPVPNINSTTFFDTCGNTIFTRSLQGTVCLPLGTTRVFYKATNIFGTSTCTDDMTVALAPTTACTIDNVIPKVTRCPTNTTAFSFIDGDCMRLSDDNKTKMLPLEAVDNCTIVDSIKTISNISPDSCLKSDILYTITARAMDKKGNLSTPCVFTFKYINLACNPDTLAPQIQNNCGNGSNGRCPDDIIINSNASCMNVPNTVCFNIRLRDYCDPNPTFTANYKDTDCFLRGLSRVKFVAKDSRGNADSCTFKVKVIPSNCLTTTPLTVSNCISPPVVFTKTDSAVVNWSAPSFAGGNCGLPVVDSTHRSGSKFPITTPTTAVIYTATNSQDKITKCTLNITVRRCVTTIKDSIRSICQGNFVQIGTKQYRTTGNYRDTLTTVGGCDSIVILNLTVNPLPIADILGNTSFCAGGSTTLTASGGVTYKWSTNATTATISPNTPGNYTVTVTDSKGCQNTNTKTVTVNPVPTVGITGATSFCQGGRTTLRASGGLTYSWSNNQTTDSIVVTTAGPYTVTATDANGCSASKSQNVSVNPLPNPTIAGNNSACEGTNITLTTSGGTNYAWSNGATTPSVSVNQTGNYIVTVTDGNGCQGSASKNITINPLPIAEITGSNTICTGSSTILTATGGGTYLWSANNATTASITVSTANTYTVTVTSAQNCSKTASKVVTINNALQPNITGRSAFCAGDSTVLTTSGGSSYAWSNGGNTASTTVKLAGIYTVTVTNANACNGIGSINITVNPLPTPRISGNSSACAGLNITLTASGGTNYLWSNGATTPSVSVNQTDNYSVKVTDANGCSASTNQNITINPLPTATISGVLAFCAGSSTTLTASGGVSYLWSTPQGGASTAIINPNQAGVYIVTVTDGNGCRNATSQTITVLPLPTPSIDGTLSFCQGGQTTLRASGGLTYRWSNSQTTDAITVTTAATYTVTATDVNNCSASTSRIVTINPLPTPTISGNTSACEGANIALTASGGTSYAWSNGETTPSVSVNQTGNYFVTATDANGCMGSTNKNITINPLPNAEIAGSNTICTGSSTTLMATGGSTYLWSTNETTASITVSAANTYTVTVTSTQNCTKTASKTVTISNVLQPTITGRNAFCIGDSTVLTTGGGSTYAWSSGGNTASITVKSAGTYTVTVTNANSCNGMGSIIVTTNPLPTPNISGDNSVCEGSSTVLTASGGISYRWADGQTTPSVSVSQLGNYIVTVTDANGCSASINRIVTIRPLPTAVISGVTAFCFGNSTNLTASGGISYLWSTGATTATVNLNQAAIYSVTVTDANNCQNSTSKTVIVNSLPTIGVSGNLSFCQGDQTTLRASGAATYRWASGETTDFIVVSRSGTYTVTATDVNNCSNSTSRNITVNPLPIPVISGNSSTCEGTNLILTASGGTLYAWSNGQTTPSVSVGLAGNYIVTVTGANGCLGSTNKIVTINPLPNAEITGSSSICTGTTTTLTATGGGTYAWSTGATTAIITISEAKIYTVTVTSAQGCIKIVNKTVTIGNALEPNITGNNSFCPGDSAVLTTSGGSTYAWSNGATTPSITVRQAGTYTVTVTSASGCNGSTSIGVSLRPAPTAVISGPVSICEGNTARLTATGGTTYLWSTTETTPTIAVTQAGTYFVTVTNTEGCRSTASRVFSVSPKATSKFIAAIAGGRVTMTNQSTNASFYSWQFGDGSVSLEKEPVYTYRANGTYCIQLIAETANGCRDTSIQCITITRVATQDLPQGYSIDVLPNPFNDLLTIKVALPTNLVIKSTDFMTIYDVLGKTIKHVKLENSLISINSSDWLEGVYLVSISIDNRQYLVSKLVKMNR